MERTGSEDLTPEQILAALKEMPQFAAVPDSALAEIASSVESVSQDNIIQRLREVELFQELGDEDLRRLHGISEVVVVEEGQEVFEEGDKGDAFYVVLRGAVELSKKGRAGTKDRLAISRAGDSFGEMALLNDAPRSAAAIAQETSTLVSIPKDAFQGLMDTEGLTYALLKHLSKALWATSVRFAQAEKGAQASSDVLGDIGRLMRQQMLPKGTPQLGDFHVAAYNHQDEAGLGDTAWSWFKLRDGRPVLCVMSGKAQHVPVAHYLSLFRILLREAGRVGGPLNQVLATAFDELREEFIPGMEPSISVGLVSLGADGIEWSAKGNAALCAFAPGGEVAELMPGKIDIGEPGSAGPVSRGGRLLLYTRADSAATHRALEQTFAMDDLTARGTVQKIAELVAGRMAGLAEAGDACYVLIDVVTDVVAPSRDETPAVSQAGAAPAGPGAADVAAAGGVASDDSSDQSSDDSDPDEFEVFSNVPT